MLINKNIYITLSIFFLVAVFLFLFFIYLPFKDIQQKSQELISKKTDTLVLKDEFKAVKDFKENYDAYKPELEKIDNLFIDSQNPVEFIKYLEDSASDFGIDLNISTPSFSKEEGVPFANFQLASFGDFSKILVFIRSLEAGTYLIKIQNLDIEGYSDKKSSEKQVSAEQSKKASVDFLIKVFAKSI